MLPAAARADDNLAAYLRARAADAEGSERAAAAGYATALAADPANAELAIRAYRAGLAAGDMALARRARGVLESAGVVPADAALIALGDALNGGDAAKINDAVKAIAAGPFSFLAPSIRAWLAPLNDAGAVNAALDGARGSALASRFADHTRLLTDIAGGRVATGMTMARLMTVSDPGAISLRVAAAQMLAGAGQREAALSLLPADTATLAPYRAALGSGTPATARIGIAWLYIQLAESLGDKRVAPAAVALSR
ncbi:MAG: tetratricopeptide repeat protein, partial [Sphingomonas sp.]